MAKDWKRSGAGLLAGWGLVAGLVPGPAGAVVTSYLDGQAFVDNPANFSSATTAILTTGGGLFGFGQSSCSGVAVSDFIVLTAAHCLAPGRMQLRAAHDVFDLRVPEHTYRVALAQGRVEPILRKDGDLVRPDGLAATAFGTLRAAAIVRPGDGPDLAMLLVSPGHNPLRSEPFQSARLRTASEVLAISDAGQGLQRSTPILLNAQVEGYSRNDQPQQLSGGVMLAQPGEPYFGFPSRGGWTNRGFVQFEDTARYHLLTPVDAAGMQPNTMIFRHGRVAAGDSGGPLYGSVVGSNQQRIIGITVQGDPDAPPGANTARWVSVGEYQGLLQAMQDTLAALPAAGTTALYGHVPQSLRVVGQDYVNTFSVRSSPFDGMQYFDPLAGTAESLQVTGATQGILQMDLLGLGGDSLSILAPDANGQFVPADYRLGAQGRVEFLRPYRSLRLEGLAVDPGEPITLGLRFQATSFGVVNLEWRNIGAVTAVPEPAPWLLLLGGLGLAAARARRRPAAAPGHG